MLLPATNDTLGYWTSLTSLGIWNKRQKERRNKRAKEAELIFCLLPVPVLLREHENGDSTGGDEPHEMTPQR